MAVAAAGAVLGIHPFNQPDVQLAKDLSHQAMERGVGETAREGKAGVVEVGREEILKQAISALLNEVRLGDYVAIQAYLAPTPETTVTLHDIRLTLRDRLRVATTFGCGPRLLHSTGQLHKGGPNTGIVLQIIDEPEKDLPVAETNYTFGSLIHAQALGDYQALKQRGRRVLRVHLGNHVAEELKRVQDDIPGSRDGSLRRG